MSIKKKIADFLIGQTETEMENTKRLASGESVESLRMVERSDGLDIFGVDYWKEINEGTPAGTFVEIDDLNKWRNDKKSRYGISLPSAKAIQRSIYKSGSKSEPLGITKRVLDRTESELSAFTDELIDEQVKIIL